jgi:hypothetical protein
MVFAGDGLSVQINFFETAALPLWTSGQSPITDCKMVFAGDGLSVQINFFETAALPLWTSGQSPITDWP